MNKQLNFFILLSAFLLSNPDHLPEAQATDNLSSPFGHSSLQYTFYNLGEIYDKDAYALADPYDPGYSTWQLSDAEKKALLRSVNTGPGS